MTSARLQPFCKKFDINIGCFDGTRINPRNLTQRNISLVIYNVHLCLIWESNDISFTQAKEELKLSFKVAGNVITDQEFFKYDYDPKKV